MAIQMKSPAFAANGPIPVKFTGEGDDISPPLRWGDIPHGTQELALICEDPDAPREDPFAHYVLYGLAPQKHELGEGERAGVAGRNSFGKDGYGGPMPPPGHGTHHYHFRLYALDRPLGLHAGATRDQVLAAMKGHVLDEGDLVGTYERR
jgi:Raf kinase inhibitor-like YbhB/YbcL family protein